MGSFYEPVADGVWRSTAHTTGPWDEGSQHGGPPSALLARAIEHCAPRPDLTVARVTVEILGPVPVDELTVAARVTRPGRRIELVEATMLAPSGRACAKASAWRVLRAPDAVSVPDRRTPPLPLPAAGPVEEPSAAWGPAVDGYLSAVEWRGLSGSFVEPGPGVVWTRLRHPLVPDEEPTGLQRVLAVADSGSGISSELDLVTTYFINPELTVHLHREPVGEWVCLDATTTISPGGTGLATTVLSDAVGPVGVGAQSLLVAAR